MITKQLDDWPAAPVPVKDCTECRRLDEMRRAAALEANPPGETDARVLLRRHLRTAHP